jgi:hypothetical protein
VRPDARVAVSPQPTTKYKVVINTLPKWSYFTVDNDPTKYQTLEPIMLAPGLHKIHFSGSEHFPADKTLNITVPDHDFKTTVRLDAPAP